MSSRTDADPGAPKARMVGLNHVALEVGDIDEALAFLGRVFDIRLRGRSPGHAFIDMGDQFLALAERAPTDRDAGRHFGLVVDDRDAVMAAATALGAAVGRNRFRDPWGNLFEIVPYADVQFSKTSAVLNGMGLELDKTEDARRQLSEKGLL